MNRGGATRLGEVTKGGPEARPSDPVKRDRFRAVDGVRRDCNTYQRLRVDQLKMEKVWSLEELNRFHAYSVKNLL